MSEAHAAAVPPAGLPLASAEPPLTDWSLRPFAASGRSPLWVGAGLVVAVTGLCQLLRLALDTPGEPDGPAGRLGADPYLFLDVLNAVLLAYIPIALLSLRRGRLRDLRALRPALDCDDAEFARTVEGTLCVSPARLAASGLVGALVFAALPLVDPGFWGGGPRPSFTSPVLWMLMVRSSLTGWLSGHAIASELQVTIALARIGAQRVRVDLLDLDALSPFARASQRGALAWVIASSLVSLFWLGPAVGPSNAWIIATILLLVSVSFFFSVYGAHTSIVAAKRQALDALEARIRPRARELLAGREGAPGDPRLADLVAYHGFVERVREWPVGAPALLRGALIAAIAVGSWLGGALVEQLLDRALD